MPGDKQSSSVLITGATDGLGRAAALLLAERGYRVFAAGRSAEKRAQLDSLAREHNLPLETIEMDVCEDSSVKRGVAAILAKVSSVDVLINNAGFGYYATVEDLRMEDLRRQFETNLFGVVRVTQAVLPGMREQRSGRIINVSSVAGKVAPPLFGAYSGSKFALEGLSDALRLELYPFGIHVILIEPGYIPTGFQKISGELSSYYFDAAKSGPYARVYENAARSTSSSRQNSRSTPDDFAGVVLHAIETPRPNPRYTITALAAITRWGKRILSDRAIDALLRKRYGLRRETPSPRGTRDS
ncbi:MAG TPA: SDR family NAD(P)-dependent oxidoreductase [Candidatus Dormibacteraeota bacterium]|nr:SDR family NAD(P)-dependent oxidoreductase [Candidatus Dormibacteraeota bacterium]